MKATGSSPLNKLANKLFPTSLKVYPHKSLINDKALLYFRIFIDFYLTGIMLWRLTMLYSGLDEIIYLTSVGFNLTWLYFFFTVQHRFMQKFLKNSAENYILVLF